MISGHITHTQLTVFSEYLKGNECEKYGFNDGYYVDEFELLATCLFCRQ